MEQRTHAKFNELIGKLERKYGLLENQGLEGHLFSVDDHVLKIYQWFLFSSFGSETELSLWQSQENLLKIYAPALNARTVSVAFDASIVEDASNAFCHGLLMRRGTPFFESTWLSTSEDERPELAGKIGETLANYHLAAPTRRAAFYQKPQVLVNWFQDLWNQVLITEIGSTFLPDIGDDIGELLSTAISSVITNKTVVCAHGDVNLSNIVLDSKGSFQLIDSGPALLLGAGLIDERNWTLDSWWDVALAYKHLMEQGGEESSEMFLDRYNSVFGVSANAANASMRYWQSLCYLAIVAVCCRRWSEFQDTRNPFNRFLDSKGIQLAQYIRFYVMRCLSVIGRSQCFLRLGIEPVDDIFG